MDTFMTTSRVLPEPDLYLYTSVSTPIPVHASILASASPVLENIIMSNKIIKISGVPYRAVIAFLRFLYSFRCREEEMEKYGMHLLALSHVYAVPELKKRSVKAVGEHVTEESVVDVLQLSRLCDAPDLYLKCVKLVDDRFKKVERSEGWRFLQNHDPALELDILCLLDDNDNRKKRLMMRKRQEKVYMQLSEAMECLEHICTEGCTNVGPYDVELRKGREPCTKFGETCQGMQALIQHFATCTKGNSGGCMRCKRMWQLFRLHSSICHHHDSCKVPLCRQIELKRQEEKRKDDGRWRLLVRKVASAKAMSSLSLSNTKCGFNKF
ncbi:hypothetical protein HN51_033768 [Arachis hypogaea]|uniref:BTB domain-containing protein n=1 Tax=Arachis hypogaea TaxID=3818 RepID=A0A445AAV1_ARAHY|nr:BTB/POZ and TAZ domain-containing protein 1 isoform X1 [Arachis ipaensis]XP_025641521.1 BTB/POZ and TAZ domain-containing protein 1 isoform X1 [Arachis hypogaea]QHN98496.1 BTB/POZ and TAZ domain-containing protein [Arachis hypogaea]RYR23465.1 hypothetical protein Ahy_B03g068684 isoform B [Arachis hypogaea]